MCGIAGFVSVVPATNSENILRRMTNIIRHRGPDDDGFFFDAHAALGQRRLSIIDVAGGHQPMPNETRTRWIVYNGEVFNHASLRPELEQAGHRYESRCDTETILHAYEQYGPACVERFRGMFAFAIWDQEARTLFCARDRLGIKPFYYFWDGRVFAFASEIKALLEHPAISPRLEEDLLPELLGFGYVSEERTLFRGIRKLMPGHHLRLLLGAGDAVLKIEQYWDVPVPAPTREGPTETEWIAETRRRLEETVQMRLMSDVPLGMFLSGGIDSSAIAALIRRQTNGPVKTFAVGYREAQYSELGYAATVAKAIGTEHHEIVIGMEDLFNALPRLIWHEDEPLVWPSSIALSFVSKLAAEQVKVVLTGEGSDEIFGGYERYHITLLNQKAASAYGVLPEGLRRRIRAQVQTTPLLKANLRRKLGHTFVGRENSLESLLLDNFYCAFSLEDQNRLLDSPPSAVYGNYLHYWKSVPDASPLARMLYADQKTYLVELLMKQDQMSMSASIESRVPFLDHTLVEFAMHMPDQLKIRNGVQKYVLKKAVEDLLPREIIHRKKMGFPTPIRQWLLDRRAGPLYAALQAKDGFLAEYLHMPEVESLIARHRSGVEDATDRIWRLINLQLWGDLFLTGRRDRWWDGILPATSEAREAASSVV
jgi:asparagine synthase (glutamine-hydrolysing)